MQSESRLLAIHCDWEHSRREVPKVRTHRRSSSLTFKQDYVDESESSDSDSDTEPADSGRESVATPPANFNHSISGPPAVGRRNTKRLNGGHHNADEAVESPTFGTLASVSSGLGTEDGEDMIDGCFDNLDEDEERGLPHTATSSAYNGHAVAARSKAVHASKSSDALVEETQGSELSHITSSSCMDIKNYMHSHFAGSVTPLLSPEDQRLVELNYKGKKVPVLHKATSAKKLLQSSKDPRVRVNELQKYNAPIHCFIRKKLSERVEMIMSLLTSGRGADVNLMNGDGNTPLHLAAELNDAECVKVLLAFGADPLAENYHKQTPRTVTTSISLKTILGFKQEKSPSILLEESVSPLTIDRQLCSAQLCHFVSEVEDSFNELLHSSQELNANDALMAMLQKREALEWRKTHGDIKPGIRILCLDGGGIRGLAQIETLMELERRTKQKIVKMFDWIIGTSTGGIVALGLVYGKIGSRRMELSDLRDMYLQKKDEIFSTWMGFKNIAQNTSAMEALVKKYFGEDQRMDSVDHPKVMISAVDLSMKTLPVVFFNNFDMRESEKHLSHARVWKVARATSAAPTIFKSLDNKYVDGGVKANNPSEFALPKIRDYYHRCATDMPHISVVVSVGTGIHVSPVRERVEFRGETMDILAVMSLLNLLKYAISDSEEVACKFDSQCNDLHIPHYRLNPKLTDDVDSTETNTLKLINMLYETRCYLCNEDGKALSDIISAFHRLKQCST